MKVKNKILGSDQGFTLIEIIISFSVIVIISTIGIAAFVSYSKEQEFRNGYLEFVSHLSQVRSNALAQIKPRVCEPSLLDGYGLKIETHQSYKTFALCEGTEVARGLYHLPKDVGFSSENTNEQTVIFFPILKREIDEEIEFIIESGDGKRKKKIVVEKLGGIRIEESN